MITKFKIVVRLFMAILAVSFVSYISGATESEGVLIAVLESDETSEEKKRACRKLSLIGTANSVPVLAELLTDNDLSHMARFALERIPDLAAGKALCDALAKVSGELKVGLISSIGIRKENRAVGYLIRLLKDPDSKIAAAAAIALGEIGTVETAKALVEFKALVAKEIYAVVLDACLRCAENLHKAGMSKKAAKIYDQLYKEKHLDYIRIAGFRGLVITKPKKATKLLIKVLRGKDDQMRAVAAGIITNLPKEESISVYLKSMRILPPSGQIALLNIIIVRRDSTARSTVLWALKSKDLNVRVAALQALGVVGNAFDVPMLIQTAAADKPGESEAAENTLRQLPGKGVNDAIVFAADAADAKVRAGSIKILTARMAKETLKSVSKYIGDSDEKVRLATLRMLNKFGNEKQIPLLIKFVKATKIDSERAVAEKSLMKICSRVRRVHEKAANDVLSGLEEADISTRVVLLRSLRAVRGSRALNAIRIALKDEDAQIRKTAVKLLSNWPTTEPISVLLEIAKTSEDKTISVLALRGFVRQVGKSSDISLHKKATLYQEAMNLASEVSAKKRILSALGNIALLEALKVADDCLKDNDLQQEAEAAVVKIAEGIIEDYPAETKVALKQVLQISKNSYVCQKAQELISSIEQREQYISSWQLSGPYAQGNLSPKQLCDIAFAPEKGDAADISWRIVHDKERSWIIPLNVILGGENRIAYLRVCIRSEKKQKARLEFGSDDGIKAWLNGVVIHANNTIRAITLDEDKVEVTLKQGCNTLMLKITQGSSDWAASARMRALDGSTIEGIKVSAECVCLRKP